ncbi:hypothetical protein CYMTET_56871, partial [Cymbomonas tetramitiformis]
MNYVKTSSMMPEHLHNVLVCSRKHSRIHFVTTHPRASLRLRGRAWNRRLGELKPIHITATTTQESVGVSAHSNGSGLRAESFPKSMPANERPVHREANEVSKTSDSVKLAEETQKLDDSYLEKAVLDFEIHFSKKMERVCKYYRAFPVKAFKRLAEVLTVALRIYLTWAREERCKVPLEKRSRGTVLRNGISQLGPVFVKLAQTLSTRPDIVGDEAAGALSVLQDQWEGPVVSGDPTWGGEPSAPVLFATLSEQPVAAASIGQVYRGQLACGMEVAVKVQRPNILKQVSLDMYVTREVLEWFEQTGFNGSEDLPLIVDEVGTGIFYELDYRQEGKNADDFQESLGFLDYLHIPRTFWDFTRCRVLTQEWIHGRPMKALSLEEQKVMVKMGVDCSAVQLLRTGLIHADPHEGNMLFTDDGKLALLDFGLVCRVDNSKQEAMANCVLNILNANWAGVVDNLRGIEILPRVPSVFVDPSGQPTDFGTPNGTWKELTDAEFKEAFSAALSGGEGGDSKRNFTQLVMDLTKLAGQYKFQLPSYMVFIIRSITTLDFCAVRTNCNMYEVAAPVALWRALTPKTPEGTSPLVALWRALTPKTPEGTSLLVALWRALTPKTPEGTSPLVALWRALTPKTPE